MVYKTGHLLGFFQKTSELIHKIHAIFARQNLFFMKKTYKHFFSFVALAALLVGCYKHDWEKLHPAAAATPCVLPDTVSYAHDIQPILAASCGDDSTNTSCHGPNNGGITGDFTGYGNAQGWAPDTLQTSTGNIYQAITTEGTMPKSGYHISSCDIRKIAKWINQQWPQ